MKIPTLILALTLAQPLYAQWPQFLGPGRDGHATAGQSLATSFSADGPKVLWQHDCGDGFAGPIVSDDGKRAFLYHRVGQTCRLDCLDVATGKIQWTFSHDTDYRDSFGFDPGPRSTPTLADGKIFLHGADGLIHAVSAKDGKLLWKWDFAKEYDSEPGFFGRCSSPLVWGKLVIANVGGSKDGTPVAMAAFQIADGKTAWEAGKQEAGYASPQLLPTKEPQIVAFLRDGLLCVDAATGAERFAAAFRSENNASVNASTPVLLSDTSFFASSCYEVGAGVWKDGKNVWKAQERLDCHYGTPVLHNGVLYGLHGRQETGTELRCVSPQDGKVLWKGPGLSGGAEIILADSSLLILTDKGELILAKTSNAEYAELDRAQILKAGHRSPPALSGGVLFARDKEKLVAVNLRGK
jgi:outer membrane protein assembly factor BamB